MLWTELFHRRARLVTELAKAGTTAQYLRLDLRDVDDPGVRAAVARISDDREQLLMLALEWFGDLRKPQPNQRREWSGHDEGNPERREHSWRTPDWRRPYLHRLRDDEGATAAARAGAGKGEGGRPEGSQVAIPEETFWEVWRLALDENASARAIERATSTGSEWGFVNKEKAGVIVKAVRKNKATARRALADQITPPGFLVTDNGVLLPKRESA